MTDVVETKLIVDSDLNDLTTYLLDNLQINLTESTINELKEKPIEQLDLIIELLEESNEKTEVEKTNFIDKFEVLENNETATILLLDDIKTEIKILNENLETQTSKTNNVISETSVFVVLSLIIVISVKVFIDQISKW